jgi:hypothetical protein
MRNAAAAEWILSLVVAPDRAASTVGDLVEEASSRGTLWFWSSLLRTACSHFWRDLLVSPLRTVRLAFWGLGASWILGALLGMTVSLLRVHFVDFVPHWEHPLILVLVVIAAPLLAGWEVARRSAGRDLPAAFAVAALLAAFHVVSLYLSAMQVRRIGIPWPGMENAFTMFCVRALCVIAGAILFRCRTLGRRKRA